MYELIQVSEHCFYIQCPAKIGVVKTGDAEVCLIDSGNDKDAGKKVKRILDANGWKLKAVYNTHSHADHIGGNRYLQTQTGCCIYAPGIERAFTEYPVLEPSYLYGGNPPRELRHKFLMAQSSDVMPLTKAAVPEGWEILPLPGHSFDMVGFRTPDNVVYLADCLSGRQTLEKYTIGFLTDVHAYLKTLEKVRDMQGDWFIPSHAEAAREIAPLAELNMQKVMEIGDEIIKLCSRPSAFDQILKELFERYGLVMTFEQHALIGSTVRSYLTWLTDAGKLKLDIKNNVQVWYVPE